MNKIKLFLMGCVALVAASCEESNADYSDVVYITGTLQDNTIRKGFEGDQRAIAYFGLTKTPWHSEDEVPYPDAFSTLAALKQRGYKLGVVANQNYGTEQRLKNWNLRQFFDVIAASAELGMAKPDPAIFEWALQKADCCPQDAVMVGDRMDNDMAPANRLGMHTVRLLRGLGAYHKPQSADEKPEYTISSLAELLDLLG